MPPKTYPEVARVIQLADHKPRRLLLEELTSKQRLDHPLAESRSLALGNVVTLIDRVGSFGSVEVDELSALTPKHQRDAVMTLVQGHIAMEFGPFRISQHERTFTVQHRNLEELIGALLRVQYHVHQSSSDDLQAVGIPPSFLAMGLTWGVGSSIATASDERLKRRRRKRFLRTDPR